MRTVVTLILAAGLSVLPGLERTACAARISTGLEYDLAIGDTENALGLYASYFQEIDDLLGFELGLSYASGDFSVDEASGDYTRVGFDASLLFRFPGETYTTYLGAGTGYHLNNFDGIEVQDKLSMLFQAGANVDLTDSMDLHLNLRYRALQPDTVSGPVDDVRMDALVVRVGVSWPL